MKQAGYVLNSGNRSGSGLVGRSPWTARDAPVPLPEAEAGASARARAPAPPSASNCTDPSQAHTQLKQYGAAEIGLPPRATVRHLELT
jgi:hypothetical protein